MPEGGGQPDAIRKVSELKYKYINPEFWCREYHVDAVGKNAKKIQERVEHQLSEDQTGRQLTISK